MNCYNHHEDPAVGVCKICNKGLCPSCARESTNGLTCSNECTELNHQYNAVMNYTVKRIGVGKGMQQELMRLIFFGVMGGILIYMLFKDGRVSDTMIYPVAMWGALMLYFLYQYFQKRKSSQDIGNLDDV